MSVLSSFHACLFQVLDGVGVGGTEKNEAKLKFIGKVRKTTATGIVIVVEGSSDGRIISVQYLPKYSNG